MDTRPQYPPQLPSFGSCTLKVRRAEQHIADLQADVTDYLRANPYRVVEDLHSEPGNYIVRIKVIQWPPQEWAPRVGDALGNLRAALDHAVYDLTVANKGESLTGTAFPIFTDPALWDEARKGKPTPRSGLHKTRGVHDKAREVIERMQPYPGRENPLGTALAMLNDLVNIDKHRALTLHGTAIRNAILWAPQGSESWVTGPGPFIDGQPLATCKLVDGRKPDLKLDMAFDVAFDQRTPYRGTPVVAALRSMSNAVVEVIAALTHFVWE